MEPDQARPIFGATLPTLHCVTEQLEDVTYWLDQVLNCAQPWNSDDERDAHPAVLSLRRAWLMLDTLPKSNSSVQLSLPLAPFDPPSKAPPAAGYELVAKT